jgi:hypothetical protein
MGMKIRIAVTVDGKGIHVDPEIAEVPFKAANAELIWTIRDRRWRFTENGIQIKPADGTARLAWLLQRRDRHWIDLLESGGKGLAAYRSAIQRAHARFVAAGHGQFHSPKNTGTQFRWMDYNDYAEFYEYAIELTDGSNTIRRDPAIKNQGC